MRTKIASIVEGHGEVEAVPILLRRIVAHAAPDHAIVQTTPIRVPRGKIVHANDLSRYVELARNKAGEHGAILILADEDEDCAKELVDSMFAMDMIQSCSVPIAIVFASRCFETWFVVSAKSFAGKRDFPENLVPPEKPEEIQNPKRWLEQHNNLNAGIRRWSYKEPVDQPGLTADLDIEVARRNESFDKLYREVVRLLND